MFLIMCFSALSRDEMVPSIVKEHPSPLLPRSASFTSPFIHKTELPSSTDTPFSTSSFSCNSVLVPVQHSKNQSKDREVPFCV
ncbi:hypothetical protein HMI55_002430 [Coelomomyces lativittatus]|nr:hypothetical protein HMI55_002430 [Coelomomyces lativittatus]